MSDSLKILVVFGTRPEAIKMAPLVKALGVTKGFIVKVCVTAQHRQMLDQVLNLFNIQPSFDLNLMRPGQDLTDITSSILLGMRTVFKSWHPDLVLVHGDTTTAMAVGLAAFYEKITVAHVEAGLRTGDIYSPWPEEMNRRIAGVIASIHFAPTETAKNNLINEGVPKESIVVTGNTVLDSLLEVVSRLKEGSQLLDSLCKQFNFLDKTKKLILLTGHRRENFGQGFKNICMAINKISQRKDVEIIYPVHLNPNVQETVNLMLGEVKHIHLIEPLDYLPFVYLMNRAHIILTDSGGIQEEAPTLGKPVLVLRETTERTEAVSAGTVKLVGTDVDSIVMATNQLLDDPLEYQKMSQYRNPYGDGRSALRIVNYLLARNIKN